MTTNKNSTKFKSNKQEKRVAMELEGKVTVASGALSFQKADVRNEQFLVECKTTAKTFYSLTVTTWNKIKSQAVKDGLRIPLMCIDLEDGKTSVAIISYNDFVYTGLDLEAQYLGNPEPILTEAKSYRVTTDFIGEDFPQSVDKGQYPCYRRDIKFVDHNIHLVILPWDDFVTIVNRMKA